MSRPEHKILEGRYMQYSIAYTVRLYCTLRERGLERLFQSCQMAVTVIEWKVNRLEDINMERISGNSKTGN